MPSLTFAALLSSVDRSTLTAMVVACGVLVLSLLLLPDPTESLTLLFVPIALLVGVAVARTTHER